eukprot:CAMPEP_0172558526 /NCGR_PEP_ID=MMETSP1067-20121228/79496_1 /TAXON_ID=265564 ORGANISM="Thalassiosira punctigera, Strain Tpunct2005C2" /NCGR_SAMPLE_ID=MMETSP1067 /ASSEMBLY_ACC=CAM_ASM_000444 /LENGTH=658 /DNA_ID=CAMNT_0013347907 /DNA_START=230 /DNA_END=2203 /DNA_ORIENTATION=+
MIPPSSPTPTASRRTSKRVIRHAAFPPATVDRASLPLATKFFLLFVTKILIDFVTAKTPWHRWPSPTPRMAKTTASCYIAVYAVLESTSAISPSRINRMFAPLIISSSLGVASPLEDLHDLDDDDEHIYEGIHGGGDGGNGLLMRDVPEKVDVPINQPRDNMLSDDEYSKNDSPNIVDRFSRAIAKEIIRRWMIMQSSFHFHSLWRNQKRRQKPGGKELKPNPSERDGSVDTDMSDGKDSTLALAIDIQNERRVGAWCPPDSLDGSDAGALEEAGIDKSVVSCSPDTSKSLESAESCQSIDDGHDDDEGEDNDIDDVQSGMVVYVFPQGEFNAEPKSSKSATSLERIDYPKDLEGNDGGSIHGTRCLLERGRQYDDDTQVIQYTLLRREPVELGHVDVHRKDFAYQPVALTIGGVGDGHELQTRIKPEEEAIETVVKLPSHQQLPWNDDAGGDQQVSFRWFSWFSHFLQAESYPDDDKGLVTPGDVIISQPSGHQSYQYHGGHPSPYHGNALYEEEGKRPFAGGSHGEIWRARRRCPRKDSNRSETTLSCDDGKDLIVKRLKIEHGYAVLEAGLREVYFGELLAREAESSGLFTTYVDHFFREGGSSDDGGGGRGRRIELWIVFEDAGPSLRSFLYTPITAAGGFVVFQNSDFWRRLR